MRGRLKKINTVGIGLLIIFTIAGCATTGKVGTTQTYEEWLATCKDYKDVAKWMKNNFLYETPKLKDCLSRSKGGPCKVYPPEITFKKKGGVCSDAAVFAKHSLNRINPDYKAEIVHLYPGTQPDHYVTGFYVNGKLYILDYGVGIGMPQAGTWGPFENLDEYVNKVYLRWSRHRSLKWYRFGWPSWRADTKW